MRTGRQYVAARGGAWRRAAAYSLIWCLGHVDLFETSGLATEKMAATPHSRPSACPLTINDANEARRRLQRLVALCAQMRRLQRPVWALHMRGRITPYDTSLIEVHTHSPFIHAVQSPPRVQDEQSGVDLISAVRSKKGVWYVVCAQ